MKSFFTDIRLPGMSGAVVVLPGLQQQGAADPVQTWVTVLILVAIILPILMAQFGAIVLRFLGWLARGPSKEDEVVYPEPQLPAGIHLPDPTIWPAVLAFGLMGLAFAVALQSWIVLGVGVLMFVLGLGGWVVLEVKEFRAGSKR
jgi:hypothetical protein